MTWLVLLVVLVVLALTIAEALERRPRRPSEEERRANRLAILEYRRVRGVADGRLQEEQAKGPGGE